MTYVTIGGVTIGICILLATVIMWWPGLKSLQKRPQQYLGKLLPFILAWSYGVLTILAIGGAIGWAARGWLWLSNWLGDAALVYGVGGEWGQHGTGGHYLPLTATGNGLVLICTVGIMTAIKCSAKYRRDLLLGTWCGITLGISSGVAGHAAVPLAQAMNIIGDTVYGAVG
jgi:hypothetical protein